MSDTRDQGSPEPGRPIPSRAAAPWRREGSATVVAPLSAPGRAAPPFARRLVLPIAGLVAVVHLAASTVGYFRPPESDVAVLCVGSTRDRLRPWFSEVRQIADGGPEATVWLCTGRQEP